MLRFLLPLRKIKSFGLIMKTKIAIVGTGGVGGFLGGLLARRYRDDPEVDIYFISRGQALENIRSRGLIVESQQGNFTARPKAATDSAAEIGEMDYILLCTKAYDIEGAVGQIRPAIGPRTVILPFLNGVDSAGAGRTTRRTGADFYRRGSPRPVGSGYYPTSLGQVCVHLDRGYGDFLYRRALRRRAWQPGLPGAVHGAAR